MNETLGGIVTDWPMNATIDIRRGKLTVRAKGHDVGGELDLHALFRHGPIDMATFAMLLGPLLWQVQHQAAEASK